MAYANRDDRRLDPAQATRWEDRGIPVSRLGSTRVVSRTIRHLARLESAGEDELRQQYAAKVGLPANAGTAPRDRQELLSRVQQAEYWRALALNELRRECQEAGASNSGLGGDMGDADRRSELVERLAIAKWADCWRERLGPLLPRLPGLRAASALLDRFERLEAMDVDALCKEYASLGLPATAFRPLTGRAELLERLRAAAVWEQLPSEQLREECLGLSVSWCMDGGSSGSSSSGRSDAAQVHGELVERLIMASCADAWQEQGIPVKRLANIQVAVDLKAEWTRLEDMGVMELRREYGKLGLPPEAEAPKVLELLPRLKAVALWRALPMGELKKECRTLGLIPQGAERVGVVTQLVQASWAPPPAASGPGRGGEPRTRFRAAGDGRGEGTWDGPAGAKTSQSPPPCELLRDIAKHFEALELPPDANSEDLKRSYRKLALRYHPDKNPGNKQQEAARRFREVVEAHDKLCEFMKLGG